MLRFEGTLGGGKGSAPGQLDLPFFVCVLPNRDVCVADFFNRIPIWGSIQAST